MEKRINDEIIADAKRYRWLKKKREVLLLCAFFGNGCVNRSISEVDEQIDEFIAVGGELFDDIA